MRPPPPGRGGSPMSSTHGPGDLVADRYLLGDPLGHGAMGTVFAAHDDRLQRDVAVKLGPAQPHVAARFVAEALLAARVEHPNTVAVFDAGSDRDEPFIVMERLSGRSLRDVLREGGPLAGPELGRLAGDLLDGLGAAHAAGLLHRDIKPSNVLVGHRGEWKLGDFGIAKSLDGDGDDLTLVGTIVGTPGYLAPERLAGEAASVESDIYAAAAVLWEAATGEKHGQGSDRTVGPD